MREWNRPVAIITVQLLRKASVLKRTFEQIDGKPLKIDKDCLGAVRNLDNHSAVPSS